jgi:hypothetical protein
MNATSNNEASRKLLMLCGKLLGIGTYKHTVQLVVTESYNVLTFESVQVLVDIGEGIRKNCSVIHF